MRPLASLLAGSLTLTLAGVPCFAQDEDRGGLDPDKLVELVVGATEGARKKTLAMGVKAKNKEERQAAYKIGRTLKSRKVTVHFDKTPFTETLDFLRDVTGLNVVLSKKAREQVEEKEISLRLKKVKLRNCLELLLGLGDAELRYGVRHGVLWIGLKEEWKKTMEVRVIDVSDIVHSPPDFPAPRMGLKGVTWDD